MHPKTFAMAALMSLTMSACSEEALSDDPEIAGKQVDEKVAAEANSLEEAAAKAVEIRNAEIASDTQDIMDETGQESSPDETN